MGCFEFEQRERERGKEGGRGPSWYIVKISTKSFTWQSEDKVGIEKKTTVAVFSLCLIPNLV